MAQICLMQRLQCAVPVRLRASRESVRVAAAQKHTIQDFYVSFSFFFPIRIQLSETKANNSKKKFFLFN